MVKHLRPFSWTGQTPERPASAEDSLDEIGLSLGRDELSLGLAVDVTVDCNLLRRGTTLEPPHYTGVTAIQAVGHSEKTGQHFYTVLIRLAQTREVSVLGPR
jgi:hypothetical protein